MKKSAFTLIEILIVVILLGILAAIVVPQFTDASDEAKAKRVLTDERILKSAVQLYRAKEGAFPATLGALVPAYIEAIPEEPEGYTGDWGITVSADGESCTIDKPAAP